MPSTRSVAAALAGLLLASAPAEAQEAQLASASCAQLLELPQDERGQVLLWLHGYYAGAAQRAVLDRAKLELAVVALQSACEQNPTMPLIGADARALLLGDAQAPASSPAPGQPVGGPPSSTGRSNARSVPTPVR